MKPEQGILRIIDANINRAKEGLRVAEDIARFILENKRLQKKIRTIRHSFDKIGMVKNIRAGITLRDAQTDYQRQASVCELGRSDINSILYANLQRAKESSRVLEEFFKLIAPRQAPMVKKLRYSLYTLEKEMTVLKIRSS